MKEESLYSKHPSFILGFHGCDRSTAEKVINGIESLTPSMNEYDWLGHGVYFWENNIERAWKFAEEVKNRSGKIHESAVIGAVIDLGYCMDLIDSQYLEELEDTYKIFKTSMILQGYGNQIPTNKKTQAGETLIRNLDCAVIEFSHYLNRETNKQPYDSVRGVFWEGGELYPGAGFSRKNHIQICVRNPNCIKGYFLPRRKANKNFEL